VFVAIVAWKRLREGSSRYLPPTDGSTALPDCFRKLETMVLLADLLAKQFFYIILFLCYDIWKPLLPALPIGFFWAGELIIECKVAS
jgi:hypothetical protein